jgi:GNAT superfamily N-acetyltransferase
VTEISFRPAVAADVAAIVALLADDPLGASRERLEDPLPDCYRQAFAAIASSPFNELIVAELDGEVVGTLQLTWVPGLSRQGMTRAIIEAVRIAAHVRGRKLGEKLVRFAEARARERGAAMVQLTSDKSRLDAHRFYERLGYEGSHLGFKKIL